MIQTLFGSVEQEPTLLEKLKSGVQKTRAGLVTALEDALQGKQGNRRRPARRAGVHADQRRHRRPHHRRNSGPHPRSAWTATSWATPRELRNLIREHLLEILQASERAPARVAEPPAVVLVVGVNGSGKTTTIGKLAQRFKQRAAAPSCCAPPTPSAPPPSSSWKSGASAPAREVIRQSAGSDPSAVLFDALQAAKARKVDYVIVDTAGRLQTKENLMAELREDEPHGARR